MSNIMLVYGENARNWTRLRLASLITEEKANCWIVAMLPDLSKVLLRRTKICISESKISESSQNHFVLDNGSFVLAKDGRKDASLLGASIDLLVIDSCDFPKEKFLRTLRPRVADRNGLIVVVADSVDQNEFTRSIAEKSELVMANELTS